MTPGWTRIGGTVSLAGFTLIVTPGLDFILENGGGAGIRFRERKG